MYKSTSRSDKGKLARHLLRRQIAHLSRLTQIVISLIVTILLSFCLNRAESFAHSNDLAQKANDIVISEYTSLDLESCKTIQFDEETKFSTQACPSYENIPVFIYQTDGLYSLKIGEKGDNEALGFSFGRLGDKLEWRLRNGEPFAVIYRYYDNATSDKSVGSSVLAIRKVPEQVDGCIAGTVDGSLPNANEIARRFADKKIAEFKCGADSKEEISG